MNSNPLKTIPLVVLAGGRVGQVGFVVTDLEMVAGPWAAAGHEPWRLWTYGPDTLSEQTYRGQDAGFSVQIALLGSSPQVELIEPLSGPSLYHEWLDGGNPGVHHLGFYVPDVRDAVRQMGDAGYALLQSGFGTGSDGTGGFAYFDTQEDLGFIAEAIEVPGQRRPPERVIAARGPRPASATTSRKVS